MFESDPVEVALIARIGELERAKSAAAAEQARLTAELDGRRRTRETSAGVPNRRRGVAGTSASREPSSTRCPTPWPPWNPGTSPNGGPP